MADQGIKKVIVSNENLPIINSKIGGYAVRYRIISEDRNRTSHWSPIYNIAANYTYQSGNIAFAKTGEYVTVVWDKVKVKKNDVEISTVRDYELWVKWGRSDAGDWIYQGKIQGNSINLIVPNTYFIDGVDQELAPHQLTVEVFLESTPVSRSNTSLRVYSPVTQNVN